MYKWILNKSMRSLVERKVEPIEGRLEIYELSPGV
jgi:hypothetical protein